MVRILLSIVILLWFLAGLPAMAPAMSPDGRQLVNSFDAQRRVTAQFATAGKDLNPVRTASFNYTNNLVLTNMPANGISGNTVMVDALNNTVQYFYTNSLITKVIDQLG